MPTRAATSGIHLIFFVQNAAEAPRRHRQTVSAGVKRERGALCLSSAAGCEGAGSWNRSPGPGGRWSGAGSQSGPGAARAVRLVGAVRVPSRCPPAGPASHGNARVAPTHASSHGFPRVASMSRPRDDGWWGRRCRPVPSRCHREIVPHPSLGDSGQYGHPPASPSQLYKASRWNIDGFGPQSD